LNRQSVVSIAKPPIVTKIKF